MKLITYPARPVNGGPLPLALPKDGEWFYEPKYNGWRALIHVPTGTMFERHGKLLTIASEFAGALAILGKLGLEWLDCEALERRHAIGQGTLILLDTIVPDSTYIQRRFILEMAASIHGIPLHKELNKPVANNAVCLSMSYRAEGALQLWDILKQCNTALRAEFFEGVVAKRGDSPYPIQLRTAKAEFPFWMKHRWAF